MRKRLTKVPGHACTEALKKQRNGEPLQSDPTKQLDDVSPLPDAAYPTLQVLKRRSEPRKLEVSGSAVFLPDLFVIYTSEDGHLSI